jgi:glutaredoxin
MKSKLNQLNLTFTEIQLDLYKPSIRDQVKQMTGSSTVPQLYFNSHHVGGNSDFQKLSNDQIDQLIKLVKENEPDQSAPQDSFI